MTRVLVLDYSNGNANSVLRALQSAGAEGVFSDEKDEIDRADAIVLPGVGHAGRAMAALYSKGLHAPLESAVKRRQVPVLGICLGMQLMTDFIEEGDCAGLGWISGRAAAMTVDDRRRYKLPNIGWTTIERSPSGGVLSQLDPAEPFYFCHKYEVTGLSPSEAISTFRYESERVAAFERDNILGVQFHPEKSHEAGANLFRAWLIARG